MKVKILFLCLNLFLVSVKTFSISEPGYTKSSFILDPDHLINSTYKNKIEFSRKVYFFKRLIEPIVVSVKQTDIPPENLLTDWSEEWEIEEKTNGRYLIQLFVKDQLQFYFKTGSQLSPIYSSTYFEALNNKYADQLAFNEGGAYDYVVFQKIGKFLTDKVAFFFDLEDNDEDKIPIYPAKIQMASQRMETISISSVDVKTTKSNIASSNAISSTENNSHYPNDIAQSIQHVPNQRTINDIWVSNPHGILSQSDVKAIDQKLKAINQETGYEIAVVFLNSIDNQNAFDFGLELFNSWGIGDKSRNDGLLIQVVLQPRSLTFVTGKGTELVLSDASTYTIGEENIKPHFKKGNYKKGILSGLDRIHSIYKNSGPVEPGTEVLTSNQSLSSSIFSHPAMQVYLTIVGLMLFAYLIILVIAFLIKDLHRKYHLLKFFNLLIFPIIFPIPFLILFFLNKFLMNRWRNTIRFSGKTGEIMHKLEEEEEDDFLSKGQITEESVKSVDYDVWVTSDHSDVLILVYKDWINKFKKCPRCSHKTYFKVYDKTIVPPTYYSSGQGEKKSECENCNHTSISTYIIPRLRRSSSSGSGGSSSGGGSWGGGSSGGGGSSSGW